MDLFAERFPFLVAGAVAQLLFLAVLSSCLFLFWLWIARPAISAMKSDEPMIVPKRMALKTAAIAAVFFLALFLAYAQTMYRAKHVVSPPKNDALDEEIHRERQDIEPSERRDPEADRREAEEQNRRSKE